MGNTGTQDQAGSIGASAAAFPKLHLALAHMSRPAIATADQKIGLIGESITYGVGGIGNGGVGPAQSLAQLLTGAGFPSALGMSIPNNPTHVFNDNRWAAGAGWSQPIGTNPFSFGGVGALYQASAGAAANTLVFTPSGGASYDTYDVYYINAPFNGTFHVNANGSADTIINTNAAASIGVTTIAVPASAAGSIQIGTVTAGNVLIVGVEPSLSTSHKFRIGNMGVVSTTTTNWLTEGTAGIGSLDAIAAYNADIWIIALGINDALFSVPLATSIANLRALITACINGLNGSNVFLTSPIPSNPAQVTIGAEAAYTGAVRTLGSSIPGVGFIDDFDKWGGAGGFNLLNFYGYYFDGLHPSVNIGYPDLGRSWANALLAA